MSNYKVNRIGFVNFWLYDEEDFYFYDGKLLLRGTNGSGKTVTMQSFFPLIFDGNKSPERLDPFGSRDRKIEDYLLPEDFQGNENTGYLYMEFYDKEKDDYLTIGMGLRAIRNRPCEFWGFALTDNRRVGNDFLLFKEKNLRVPLTKKELQLRVGTGGEFVETQKEYKKMVNRLLFGFPSVDLYTEFINLLIQVRSPKLSNSTKPSQLTKILSTVLEPLSEEDLRTMAESIEDMNKYKETLEELKNEQKACEGLKKYYQDYNQCVLYTKGEEFLKYRQECTTIQNELKEKEKELETIKKETEKETNLLHELKLEEKRLEDKKEKLDEGDFKNISKKLDELTENDKLLSTEKETKEQEIEEKSSSIQRRRKELEETKDQSYRLEKELQEEIRTLSEYEEEIEFDDAKFYLDDLKKDRDHFKEMTSFINTMKHQVELLTNLKEKAKELENLEEEIKNQKEDYIKQDDKVKEIESKHQKISSEILEECESLKESFAKISNSNKILQLEQETLNKIYQIIDSLDKNMFVSILALIKDEVYCYKDKFKNNISDNQTKIKELEQNLTLAKDKLKNIGNILIQDLNDEKTKEYFEENKISYSYFFELVDFKEGVSNETRKNIEAFLSESGMLTSFVIDKDVKDIRVKAKCLKGNIKANHNLSKYMVAIESKYQEEVTKILESIEIKKEKENQESIVFVDESGNYQLAVLCGQTDKDYQLKYIGKKVREKYIEEETKKGQNTIDQIEKGLELLRKENKKISLKIETLEEEINNFTWENKIEELFKNLDKINLELEVLEESRENILKQISAKQKELRNLEEDFERNKKGYYASSKYTDILEILNSTKAYLEVLRSLESTKKQYDSKKELELTQQETLEELQIDLDNKNQELENIHFKIRELENKRANLEELLQKDKYKDIAKVYSEIKERLMEINDLIPAKERLIGSNEQKIITLQDSKEKLEKDLRNKEILKNVSYQILMDEYNLQYVKDGQLKENEIYYFIKSLKPNSNASLRDVYDKLIEVQGKYLQNLMNYASKIITLHIPKENAYLDFTSDDKYMGQIHELLENAKRKDLVFSYKGKSVNLLELANAIDMQITSYQDLISDENRRLFEDLLINNIGSSIREKIYASEEWIEEVRSLMESMNTSSGLSFSLKWVGNEALTENEVDTKEIVRIFRKEAKTLKEEDLTKIANHFRSKIEREEELLEEDERNYLEIIKDVLDYRKWFEFKLYFKRGDKEKKELTDREFNKMSGGEKAIAMYVPLFSSIYAKLNSAVSSAPRVIALDEAFAGVDDANIEDAFRILDKLNIDYVLTSQQLWGDYQTVKHLAISELHHPIGSKVVSIIKYKWDGKTRKKVDSEKEYESAI